MPYEITKTIYTLAELKAAAENPDSPVTSRAYERALDWVRDGATHYEWWGDAIVDRDSPWIRGLNQIGFTDPEISFSGFWSQGDGASFTSGVDLTRMAAFLSEPPPAIDTIAFDGKEEDFRGWIAKQANGVRVNPRFRHLARLVGWATVWVKRGSSNYSHEHTCYVDHEFYPGNRELKRVDALIAEFVEAVEELRLDLSRAIYKALEEEYDYRTGEEALLEDAEANEWTFDEDGDWQV